MAPGTWSVVPAFPATFPTVMISSSIIIIIILINIIAAAVITTTTTTTTTGPRGTAADTTSQVRGAVGSAECLRCICAVHCAANAGRGRVKVRVARHPTVATIGGLCQQCWGRHVATELLLLLLRLFLLSTSPCPSHVAVAVAVTMAAAL